MTNSDRCLLCKGKIIFRFVFRVFIAYFCIFSIFNVMNLKIKTLISSLLEYEE